MHCSTSSVQRAMLRLLSSRTVSLTPVESLEGSASVGAINFSVSAPDANDHVDGRPRPDYRAGLRLAAGVHDVVVRRSGFFPVEREVTCEPLATRTVRVTLEPTEETRAAHVARATGQRRWSWVTIGVGALVAGGATFLFLRNRDELRGARAEAAEVASMVKAGGQCPPMGEISDRCRMLVDHANGRLDRAERARTLAIIGIGSGAAVLLAGTILRALSDDPHRYDFEPPKADPAIGVFAALRPDGSTVVVRGRF